MKILCVPRLLSNRSTVAIKKNLCYFSRYRTPRDLAPRWFWISAKTFKPVFFPVCGRPIYLSIADDVEPWPLKFPFHFGGAICPLAHDWAGNTLNRTFIRASLSGASSTPKLLGNRSSTNYDNLTLLNIYDAEATEVSRATCCQRQCGGVAGYSDRRARTSSLSLTVALARTRSALRVMWWISNEWRNWGRRWLRNCCSNRSTRTVARKMQLCFASSKLQAPPVCIIYVPAPCGWHKC